MDALAPFRIPSASLKADGAVYDWDLDSRFLNLFDEEHEGIDGQFSVHLDLQLEGGISTALFQIHGEVRTTCDRCMMPIVMPVQSEFEVMIKYGDPGESTDEIIFVDPDAPVFDAGQLIYDFVMLSVPISHRIPGCEQLENPPCDFSVLKYLTDHPGNEIEKGNEDSPLKVLKNIIDN